ncbi:class I adenylate-forming enzyme family protein [Reichenbachiella ulvae]|uniref:Acyl--CoA ligase n=1 Tax=Reichenbachiella ulvae TaxID=2980104 RepID=A0ABT3CVV0_9BACT|nr:class I adenylate-forming enzyme family protein [Reichenbachiella ulvae]MCV9387830.1 acyl--CoA ligase [Reichenbachiella ulvae]
MKKLEVFESLIQSAQEHPDQIALIDEMGELSYAQLLNEVNALKQSLVDSGLKMGQSVGLLTENNRHFIIGLYAIIATGAVAMPIFHKQKAQEILQSINEAELTFVLSSHQKMLLPLKLESEALNKVFHLASTVYSDSNLLQPFPEAAFMRFTSGTTGQAKGVVINHRAAIDRIEAANQNLQIGTDTRVLWVFPMAYHFIVSIVLYIHRGATIIINNDFLAEDIISSIQKHQANFFYCAPMHLKLLAAYEGETNIGSLKRVISTTTGASRAICESFQDKYQIDVEQAFGIIEIGLPIINTVDPKAHPDAVGQVLPSYEVKILDEENAEVKSGETGRLAIKGPGMFEGYLKSPRQKNEILADGFFLTGDLASQDEKGTITIRGREKNVIIVHGNKVFPNEVEEVINQFPEIKLSKVFGQPHPLTGEVVVAEITAEEEISQEVLIKHCRQSLSPYKVPQKIIQLEQIEMTASGKIKRV